MKCRRAQKLFFDFLDGVVSESDRVELEAHLMECEKCAAEASSLTRSIDLIHRLPVESPAENFNWKVRLQIAREKASMHRAFRSERTWLKSWNIRFAASAVGAFIVALVVGYLVVSTVVLPGSQPGLRVADDTRASHEPTPPAVGSPIARRGPEVIPVSGGAAGHADHSVSGPILDSSVLPVIEDPDSLVFVHLQNLRMRTRIVSLQQQLDELLRNLRECENECEKTGK